MFSNARPCGQFLLANARSLVPSVVVKCPALQSIRSIHKIISCHILINITVSAQYKYIKQVTKWVTPTEKGQNKWFYCFYRSFIVDKCSSPTPKWQCLTAWNPWLWAPSEITTGFYETSLLLFTNARWGDTLYCQMPGPRDSSWNKCPGFARGGCSRLELTRTLAMNESTQLN